MINYLNLYQESGSDSLEKVKKLMTDGLDPFANHNTDYLANLFYFSRDDIAEYFASIDIRMKLALACHTNDINTAIDILENEPIDFTFADNLFMENAIRAGNLSAVKILVEFGIDISKKEHVRMSTWLCKIDILKFLLQEYPYKPDDLAGCFLSLAHGAIRSFLRNDGITREQRTMVIQILLDAGMNCLAEDFMTGLEQFIRLGHLEVVQLLHDNCVLVVTPR
jgi:hypothetical protein